MAAGELLAAVCMLLLLSVFGEKTFTRKVSVEMNPGALTPPPGGDLLHVRAMGNNDTLHFLFCSLGAPTLLLIHTNTSSSSVKVNWSQFLARNVSGSLKVEPESSILYSSGLVFSRLLEYEDVNDTAEVTSDLFPPYNLQDLNWARLNLSDTSAVLCGTAANGSFCLRLATYESEGRGPLWPRLQHTANSSQVTMWLDGMSPRSNRSRFLLELQAVGGAYPLSRVEVQRSIDDEFTPSIFQVTQWVAAAVNDSADVRGFVQWKPVAYRRSPPSLEDATSCRHSDVRRQSGTEVEATSALIRGFYDGEETRGLNVSFGLPGDSFYNRTKFLSWTLTAGIGPPPVDFFSPLVLTTMAVGLGAPLIIVILGGVCICARRRGAAAYKPIN